VGLIGALLHRRTLWRWTRAARTAPVAELGALKTDRARAKALRTRLDDLIAVADSRLALPRIGSNAFPRPPGTDWAWRPDLWRRPMARRGIAAAATRSDLGGHVSLFHDCTVSELTARQIRNQREVDLAPFGLRLDVFRFDGSFLSLVIDLPQDGAEGLRKRHLLRLTLAAELEKPLEIFARLNVKHGPNVEQIVREMPLTADEVYVEFDLAYTKLNEKRAERLWLDLIFEGPEMNQITLRDVTFARYPRAEL
jgi:hypothetical protein